MARAPSVSTGPGSTQFTRIFFGPSSAAGVRVNESMAALVPLYTEPPVKAPTEAIELMLVTDPPLPCALRLTLAAIAAYLVSGPTILSASSQP